MKQSRPIDVLCRPNFRYTPSGHTDLKSLFKRLRNEQREAEERDRGNVKQIIRRKNGT